MTRHTYRIVSGDSDPNEIWWCSCEARPGPHVHCVWGGLHTHDVDTVTGWEIET